MEEEDTLLGWPSCSSPSSSDDANSSFSSLFFNHNHNFIFPDSPPSVLHGYHRDWDVVDKDKGGDTLLQEEEEGGNIKDEAGGNESQPNNPQHQHHLSPCSVGMNDIFTMEEGEGKGIPIMQDESDAEDMEASYQYNNNYFIDEQPQYMEDIDILEDDEVERGYETSTNSGQSSLSLSFARGFSTSPPAPLSKERERENENEKENGRGKDHENNDDVDKKGGKENESGKQEKKREREKERERDKNDCPSSQQQDNDTLRSALLEALSQEEASIVGRWPEGPSSSAIPSQRSQIAEWYCISYNIFFFINKLMTVL